MERLNEALNYLGSHIPTADWFTRLDGTQKAVFLSNVGVIAILIICILVLLRKRMKVVTKVSPEYLSELSDLVGDKLLEDAKTGKISGKEYKWLCRDIGMKLPDLRGKKYTKRAEKEQHNRRLKYEIAQRIKALKAWVPISLFTWQHKARELEDLKTAVKELAESNKALRRDSKKAKANPGDAAAETQKYLRRKDSAA